MAPNVIDPAVLAVALGYVGGGIVVVMAFLDKIREKAVEGERSRLRAAEKRLDKGLRICGEQIDEALEQHESVRRLRIVQEALSDPR